MDEVKQWSVAVLHAWTTLHCDVALRVCMRQVNLLNLWSNTQSAAITHFKNEHTANRLQRVATDGRQQTADRDAAIHSVIH